MSEMKLSSGIASIFFKASHLYREKVGLQLTSFRSQSKLVIRHGQTATQIIYTQLSRKDLKINKFSKNSTKKDKKSHGF